MDNLALYSALSTQTSNRYSWVIDSGASRHITGFKENLDSFIETCREEVTIGDDTSYPIMGIGNCLIQLKSGITLQLSDVLYVPSIKQNLVSISALEDKGYRITFMEGKVLAWPKNSNLKQAYTIGIRHECLYKLDTTSLQALSVASTDPCELWHRRLGHLNFQTLSSMFNLVVGLPNLPLKHEGVCKGCALGKNIKTTFNNSESKTKEILEIIHTDLCGPMSVPSIGGCLYYIIFVDDFSRKTWIYFLKSKESIEVLKKFKEFKSLIENLTNKRIKVLRSDNGGEYTFEVLCWH